jgi:hypothetical protein
MRSKLIGALLAIALAGGAALLFSRSDGTGGGLRKREMTKYPRVTNQGRRDTSIEPGRISSQGDHGGAGEIIATNADSSSRPETTLDSLTPAEVAEVLVRLGPGQLQDELVDRLLTRWVKEHFSAALEWVTSLPAGALQQRALLRIADHWLEESPTDAMAFAETLPQAGNLFLSVLMGKIAERNPEQAIAWLLMQPEGAQKTRLTCTLLGRFAREVPEAAALYVTGLPSGDIQIQGAATVVAAWVGQDPTAAAEWAKQLPAGRAREYALEVAAAEWIQNDPAGALNWLHRLPPGSDLDSALNAGAGRLLNSDPSAAAILADAIGNDAVRYAQVGRAVNRWIAVDPAAASAWLVTTDLPKGFRQSLLSGR